MGKLNKNKNQAQSDCSISSQQSDSELLTTISTNENNENIDNNVDTLTFNLSKFWSIEECSNEIVIHPHDHECELFFLKTTYRDERGCYTVKLPFITNEIHLGDSRTRALNRLFSLESKFRRDPSFYEHYTKFMAEYLKLGHMSETDEKGDYYIPHHGIWQISELQPKLRVVFDASGKSSNGKSLNDYLLSGPKLQKDIVDILTNFRVHPIVFTTDVSKMYRQILICPEDRKYQFVLWRSNLEEPVKTFALNTLTYGTTSAPYLAQRVIQKLVEDEGSSYPEASRVLRRDIYVDDIITGSYDLKQALNLKRELLELFSKAGFQLHKWSSNSREFLSSIGVEFQNDLLSFDVASDHTHLAKILGLYWDPVNDSFVFRLGAISDSTTKRTILSCIARLYDPCGFLSPVTFYAKSILQQLWKEQADWDDVPSEDILKQWESFKQNLGILSSLTIPRLIFSQPSCRRGLIGFCDASEKGYASVIYYRTFCSLTQTYNSFVLRSKTKLAPIKTVTLPRLELCAAHLLAKLYLSLQAFITEHVITEIRLFTDATIVLHWLNSGSQKLPTFVQNRVGFILNTTPLHAWAHVRSNDNPADLPSRGILPQEIINNSFWWNGPHWMSDSIECWPTSNFKTREVDLNAFSNLTIITDCEPINDFVTLTSKSSSLVRLLRICTFVLNFISKSKRKVNSKNNIVDNSGTIRTNYFGYGNAFIKLTSIIQYHDFHLEFCYKTSKPLSNRLLKLNTYLDSNHLLRVGGRLTHSDLLHNQKYPILLNSKSELAKLVAKFYHNTYYHANFNLLQALVNKRFWILGYRTLFRKVIFSCNICYRLTAKPKSPFMADLPASRVTKGYPFLSVGIDYAGPVLLKESKRRNAKALKSYIAVFVCMATKAVHVELVSDLTSAAFLAALNRFTARRGLPHHIYSDCGTNFIGASRQLKELYKFLNIYESQSEIQNYLSRKEIQWHFGPPAAPHFGGIWEAAVKSMKYHLIRVLRDHALTFEELSTVLSKIEAILNSRPLCPLSPLPDNFDFLSPGHFLIGRPLVSVPEKDDTDTPLNRLNRWQLLNSSIQHVWKRWSSEYLHTLQQRTKWFKGMVRPFQLNDLVLITDKNVPPLNWPAARVMKIHPGPDGVSRVVTLRTKSGNLLRPVHKLVHLMPENLNDEQESHTQSLTALTTLNKIDETSLTGQVFSS